MGFNDRPRRSRAPLFVVGGAVLVVVFSYARWTAVSAGDTPTVTIDAPDVVGFRNIDVKVTSTEPARGVVDFKVTLAGAGLSEVVLVDEHREAPAKPWHQPETTMSSVQVKLGKEAYPALTEGTLTLTVTATGASSWWRTPEPAIITKTITVDLTPPTVVPMSSFVHVAQGGAEVIVYQVGPGTAKSGVVVDRVAGGAPWEFIGSPLPAGAPGAHFVIFALPYDDAGPEADVKKRVRLFADDVVGNRATAPFVHKYFVRPMPRDTITLRDPFLAKVTSEIFPQTKGITATGKLLDDYLVLNRELRKTNNAFLIELSQQSAQRFLWSQTFQPFDNASIKGAFADRRTYLYNDEKVDEQDHLGFDLARVERSPVNAGNDGVVVHAEYFGIFGNCVVIDHGFGLMTLYAHLSAIAVKAGDAVSRGQVIGTTGATGLAGGDHLHFTTLVHGQAVNPIEWWDGHWIRDRVKLKLGDALPWSEATNAAPPRRGR